jgi:3-methyladenine DNA glycosylase AlkD
MGSRVEAIHRALRAAGDEERIRVMSGGYAPTALEVFGTSMPDARKLASSLAAELKAAPSSEVLLLCQALVDAGSMEGRIVAYLLLARDRQLVDGLGGRALDELGRGNDNWATADAFACMVVGPSWTRGADRDATVLRWARSRDRWWRRIALASTVALNQKSKGGSGDVARTLRVCRLLVADHDDMVVKAMSWALRTLAAVEREPVEVFLAEHETALHKRVLREVRRKIATGKKS